MQLQDPHTSIVVATDGLGVRPSSGQLVVGLALPALQEVCVCTVERSQSAHKNVVELLSIGNPTSAHSTRGALAKLQVLANDARMLVLCMHGGPPAWAACVWFEPLDTVVPLSPQGSGPMDTSS